MFEKIVRNFSKFFFISTKHCIRTFDFTISCDILHCTTKMQWHTQSHERLGVDVKLAVQALRSLTRGSISVPTAWTFKSIVRRLAEQRPQKGVGTTCQHYAGPMIHQSDAIHMR